MISNNLGNALCGDAQRVVGFCKSLHYREVGINLSEAFIIDNQQRIDVLSHRFDTIERLINFASALKSERNGNDTHRKDTQLFCYPGNNWRSSGSRSSTHSGGNENHLGTIVQYITNVIDALFGCNSCSFGSVSGTKALLSQLQMYGYGGIAECLIICIAEHKRNLMNTLAIHVIDSITATAAYTNNLDDAALYFGLSEINQTGSCIVISHSLDCIYDADRITIIYVGIRCSCMLLLLLRVILLRSPSCL